MNSVFPVSQTNAMIGAEGEACRISLDEETEPVWRELSFWLENPEAAKQRKQEVLKTTAASIGLNQSCYASWQLRRL